MQSGAFLFRLQISIFQKIQFEFWKESKNWKGNQETFALSLNWILIYRIHIGTIIFDFSSAYHKKYKAMIFLIKSDFQFTPLEVI